MNLEGTRILLLQESPVVLHLPVRHHRMHPVLAGQNHQEQDYQKVVQMRTGQIMTLGLGLRMLEQAPVVQTIIPEPVLRTQEQAMAVRIGHQKQGLRT